MAEVNMRYQNNELQIQQEPLIVASADSYNKMSLMRCDGKTHKDVECPRLDAAEWAEKDPEVNV